MKLIRPSTRHQQEFNHGAIEAVRGTLDEVDGIRNGLVGVRGAFAASESALADVEARLADTERQVRDDLEQIRTLVQQASARVDEVEAKVAELLADRRRDRSEIARQRAALDTTLRALRSEPRVDATDLTRPLDDRYDQFYADFASAMRGSREEIKERQEIYLSRFDAGNVAGRVLDVGPGRGEWLEALSEKGLDAYGVDVNAEFVHDGRARGLDIRHEDAFEHLRGLPEGSLSAITAFQVVEHLPFEVLDEFLGLALTRLRPDGVILLETPNPSNLRVGAMSFWNDPSHVHPLPPVLLDFLVTWRGFVDVEVVFGPSDGPGIELDDGRVDDLNWALFGPQDYAVVGRRP